MLMGVALAMLFTAQSTMAQEGKGERATKAGNPSSEAPAKAEKRIGDPYTLATCAVSGEDAWADGEPKVILLNGREFKTCCNKCKGKLEADPAKFIAEVDAAIIKQQEKHYPLTTCVVGEGDLKAKGDPVQLVVNNRMVQLCCSGCKKKLSADPAKFIAQLDAAVIQQQSEDYKLKTCPISGEELGDKPKNIVIGNRLVKLCCAGCQKKVAANPAKVFAMLDSGKVTAEGSGAKEKGKAKKETGTR